MQLEQTSVRNRLIRAMSPDLFARLVPDLEPVEHDLRDMVSSPGDLIRHILFAENCILSVLAETREERVEVGMIGWEGASGVGAVFEADRSPYGLLCQRAGGSLRISTEKLTALAVDSRELTNLLGRYLVYGACQIAETAYANASLTVEGKLPRWVLMTHDRSEGFELSLTHDFLSDMLGVRRPGVTTAIHVLEGAGMITATRGRITVVSRSKLEDMAGAAYGAAGAHYRRLIG